MPSTVFISSTSELTAVRNEGAPVNYRQCAQNAVNRAGHLVVMQEYFAASGEATPLAACLEKVRGCDVVVVLVAHRYGSVPRDQRPSEHKSITWLECQEAADRGKEVLAFVVAEGYAWPEDLKEEYLATLAFREGKASLEIFERTRRNCDGLRDFKVWLNQRGIVARFTTGEDLGNKLYQALTEWKSRQSSAAKKARRAADRQRKQMADAHRFRRAYRRELTELMCGYYQHVAPDAGIQVAPDGMPVLVETERIPTAPVPLMQVDRLLRLDRQLDKRVQYPDGPITAELTRKRSADPNLFDGLSFRYLGLRQGLLQFGLGYYFDFYHTCEALGMELAFLVATDPRLRGAAEAGRLGKQDDLLQVLAAPDALPLRRKFAPSDFESRCTAFGTCSLVVIKGSNQPPRMVLNDRSTEMAETPGLVHVIPAGTFQPTMQDRRFLDIEFSFTENLVREFVEELYNDKGISGRPSHAVLVSDLNDLFGPLGQKFRETVYRFNRYKLMYLGTVIDPVNLKPEALTVFMIHEGYLYGISGKHLELSWETQGGRIRLIEFNEENLTSYINDPNLVPTAKAHLMMVRTHFPNLLEELQSI